MHGQLQLVANGYALALIGQAKYVFSFDSAKDSDSDSKADPAIMDSSGNWNFWLSGSFYTRAGPYYLVLP